MELACRSELDAHIKNDTFVDSANSTPDHDLAVKQIIRYLAGTAQLGLRYGPFKVEGVGGAEFFGYTDSAHADCLDSRKSTSGYMFSYGMDQLAGAPNASNALARHLLKLNTSVNVMQPRN